MIKFNLSKKTFLVLFVLAICVSYSFKSTFFEVAKQIEIYNTLFKELNMYYINEINPAELTNKAIKNTFKIYYLFIRNAFRKKKIIDLIKKNSVKFEKILIEMYTVTSRTEVSVCYYGNFHLVSCTSHVLI